MRAKGANRGPQDLREEGKRRGHTTNSEHPAGCLSCFLVECADTWQANDDEWERMFREMEALARTNYQDHAHPVQVENSRLLKVVEKVRWYLEQKPVDVAGIRMAVNGVQTEVPVRE